MKRTVEARVERWALRQPFRISRGAKTHAEVVIVEIVAGAARGRGECVPYARYDETTESVLAQIEGVAPALRAGLDLESLQSLMPPGAARNAIDCALWDLRAQLQTTPTWQLLSLPAPSPLTTAYTLSLDGIAGMAEAARLHAHRPLLKAKLDGEDVLEKIAAMRSAAPRCRLIIDANEAWSASQLADWMPELYRLRVELIEQPLPSAEDHALATLERLVPVAADESFHVAADLERVRGRYDLVNLKLDKTGGLSEAIVALRLAQAAGLGVMVGCMVATSLAIAPAMLLCAAADVVDLDGPLLLAHDRVGGAIERDGWLCPPAPGFWGGGGSPQESGT